MSELKHLVFKIIFISKIANDYKVIFISNIINSLENLQFEIGFDVLFCANINL